MTVHGRFPYELNEDFELAESADGLTLRAKMIVTNAPGVDAATKCIYALSQCPELGSRHPTLGDVVLTRRTPRMIGNGTVEVSLDYDRAETQEAETPATEQSGSITVGATLTESQTHFTHDGKEIELNYVTAAGEVLEQGGVVPKLVPVVTISVSRNEKASPLDDARRYVGKVNTAGWKIDPHGKAREWLCTAITGASNDDGKTFDVNRSFEYKEDTRDGNDDYGARSGGWDQLAMFTSPDDGRVPADVTDPNQQNDGSVLGAIAWVQVYAEADFNEMKLFK
jgi:hypothetical protein